MLVCIRMCKYIIYRCIHAKNVRLYGCNHVSMYVCMHACMHACMPVCLPVCLHI